MTNEESAPEPRDTYSLFFDAFVAGHAIRRLLGAAMAGGPLRPEEYAVYSVVFEIESVSPTAMAAQLEMPLTTVMEHLRAMEGRDHVRRVPNPRDGRSYLVVLTSAGRTAHREASRRFETAYRAMVAGLPEGEAPVRRQLRALTAATRNALEAVAATP